MIAWIRKHPLLSYFVLAFAVAWAFEIPLAAAKSGWLPTAPPFAIHYLAAFGPMVAALIVSASTHGVSSVRELLNGLLKWRIGPGWAMTAALSPLAMFGAAGIAGRLTAGEWPNLALLGEVDYLPYLGVAGATVLWLVTFGLGEEVGWRGYALPRLQERYGALKASLLLALPWSLWHLPAFLYKDTYVQMGLITGLPMLLVSLLAASVVHTWLYNNTRGSLLAVIAFHGTFDLLSASNASSFAAPVMSAIVWIWAALIVVMMQPSTLRRLKWSAGERHPDKS